jgi:pyruvate,water dikinase
MMTGNDLHVVPLGEVSAADSPNVGSKAAVLGSLTKAGFPIPAGLCLTTAAFRLALNPWMGQIDDILRATRLRDAAARIDRLLVELSVPAPVMAALRQELPRIADSEVPLAVRSSATAEDTAEASFAGHYNSAIGVRDEDALQDAIVGVWRSFFNANALTARAEYGIPDKEAAMAVLILPVVDAECAGVCLSVDPVHGRRDRTVITAAWGLGTGVVDGSVAADTYWVRRDGSTEGFEFEEQLVVEQAAQIALAEDGGLKRVPVADDRRRAACLPESWMRLLAQFSVAAEVLMRCPQDVEWAIAGGQVWMLQSRPITTLGPELAETSKFPVTWESNREKRVAWIHYPYWPHVLKPLEMDYASDREAASKESSLYTGGERFERVKIVNGRAYTTWTPNDLTDGDRRIRRAATADLAARLHSQDTTAWEHWGPEIVKATERLHAFEVADADGLLLAAHLEDARGAFRRHWSIHGSRLSVSRQPVYAAFAKATGLAESAIKEAVNQLLEGEETPSSRLVDGLYALATSARSVPEVATLVADPPPDVSERLATLPDAAAFRTQLEAFLDAFGDRSGVGYGSDATIDTPAWRDDVALMLGYVSAYLDPTVSSPADARARAQAEREALIQQLCAGCEDQEALTKLRDELAYARRQAAVMEEHNHYIDQMMNGQLRHAILAAARWLVTRGALPAIGDVFWLHYDEILRALREGMPLSFADIISSRQAQHATWEALDPPPIIGTPEAWLSERPPLQDEVTTLALPGETHVSGLGASPGQHRGLARVVATSTLLPDLSPGEVLVAENMGPRWTPLLPILGGLVLDGGNVGQHHAISAREYGVPAVISTGNATKRIRDGAWVTVDGTKGTVELET